MAPIFVLGVPRSGTTLLRTMLDSHPAIACGPETPWLCFHQPSSVMGLCQYLWENDQGYCASYQMPRDIVTSAARDLISRLFGEYARSRGKRRWAEKTPDNVLHLDFLKELFPDARFIYVVRDGLDVAASTSRTSEHRKGVSTWHETFLPLGRGIVTANNPLTAMLRWRHWNRLARKSLDGHEHLLVAFEDLVRDPESELRRVTDFVGEQYDPVMLEFGRLPHELPEWEWGTADIKAHPRVSAEPVARARREFTQGEIKVLSPLADRQRPAAPIVMPDAALGYVGHLVHEDFSKFMTWLNGFAQPLRLRTFITWSKVWEYPWLWLRAIGRLNHDGLRIVDIGSETSPMPWMLALLGAKVTLVETTEQNVSLWESLRSQLRVDVDWLISDNEKIAVPDSSVDLLTSFSVIEHQPDKTAAVNEAARILKPGGIFALSFDICEPEMGMTYPEENGQALTLHAFEEEIWRHPAFGNETPPRWLREDIPGFLEWHLRGSERHNYVVGAAVMIKR